MRIVTQDGRAKNAARAYRNLHFDPRPAVYKRPWEKIYDDLVAMHNPTADEVNAIIGNDVFTRVQCDECAEKVTAAMEFETSEFPLLLCHSCFVDAANKVVWEEIQ